MTSRPTYRILLFSFYAASPHIPIQRRFFRFFLLPGLFAVCFFRFSSSSSCFPDFFFSIYCTLLPPRLSLCLFLSLLPNDSLCLLLFLVGACVYVHCCCFCFVTIPLLFVVGDCVAFESLRLQSFFGCSLNCSF